MRCNLKVLLLVVIPIVQPMFSKMILRCDGPHDLCYWACEFGFKTMTTIENSTQVLRPVGCLEPYEKEPRNPKFQHQQGEFLNTK